MSYYGLVTLDDAEVPNPTTGKVRIYSSSNHSFGNLCTKDSAGNIIVYSPGITQEQVEDIVGNLLTSSNSITTVYDDLGNTISFEVTSSAVDHDALLHFVQEKHINHSLVSILAGTGLTGGGDITSTRTLSLENFGTSGSFGNANTIPVITTDVKGRVSGVTATAINGVPSTNITHTPSGDISSTSVAGAISELDAEKISVTQKGVAGGVVPLNGLVKIDTVYLPSYVDDVLEYANLSSFPATGESGKIYIALDTNKTYRWGASVYVEVSSSPVTSVFGRSGNITASNGDYTASQVTNIPAGNVAALTTQNAINELDSKKVAVTRQVLAGVGLTGGGSLNADVTISLPDTGTAGTYGSATQIPVFILDAQGRVVSVTNTSLSFSLSSFTTTNLAEGSNLYFTTARARAAITPTDSSSVSFSYNTGTGVLISTVLPAGVNHDAMQNFIANKHIDHSAITITAGTGLTGGGDLTQSRTFSLNNTSVTASSYGNAAQVSTFTVDAQGRLTAANSVSISILSSQVSNFVQSAQDAAGGMVTNTSSVNMAYNSTNKQISSTVLPAGVNHDATQNFVANKHIDHSAVTITGNSGLTGGGDLTTSRAIGMPDIITAATYGSASSYPVITLDSKGRVTNVSLQAFSANVWVEVDGLLTWADETGKDLCIRQASNTGDSPYLRFVKSLGTLAAPVATPTGERLGGHGSYGWNTTGVNGLPSAEALVHASENHTNTAWGGEYRIYTIANGTMVSTHRCTWQNDGLLDQLFGLRVGTTDDTTAGNIRYTNNELQVRDATTWRVVNTSPQTITSTATVTTTSSTFNTIATMTNTPAAGSYQVFFSCSASIDSDGNGDIGLFINGVEQTQCRRNQNCVVSGSATGLVESSLMFITLITVGGTDVVDVRFRRNTAGTFSVKARELIFIPIAR
jgi:hypothetical protein